MKVLHGEKGTRVFCGDFFGTEKCYNWCREKGLMYCPVCPFSPYFSRSFTQSELKNCSSVRGGTFIWLEEEPL